MQPSVIFAIILIYFAVLMTIAFLTSRNANSEDFYTGSRRSPWFLIAFGMIGASLSGVTFVSVPGDVGANQFAYLQMVIGYFFGYLVVARVLMPVYYKLNLTSIYTYLEQRFGFYSYKTGASFFLLSRTIGSAARLFLVANVLQFVVFDAWNVPFWLTVLVTVVFIWLYSFKGGVKTIIWTDTIQTVFMLVTLVMTVVIISQSLDLNFSSLITTIKKSDYSQIFFFDDWRDKRFFIKQFLSGAFITIVMTGLDQDMMQKNLSCKNIKDAQKNMLWFSIILIVVNLLFLTLGALLYLFIQNKGIAMPASADGLFPLIASQHLGVVAPVVFIIGLTAAAYATSDSALAALTTSFTIDILSPKNQSEKQLLRTRTIVHLGFTFLIFLVIMLMRLVDNSNMISIIFTIAGYTYGPLLGMYAFGLFTKWQVKDKYVPIVAIASPLLCLAIHFSCLHLWNYKFGYEMLLFNGALTFLGMVLLRKES